MVCIFQKPDGVCCEYDKQEHKGLSCNNSEYGWDSNGYCVTDTDDVSKAYSECCLYDEEDDLK